ncbi:MAG: ribosome-associated heat shock protein Hsp15 [Polaribacter sp.]|jgi:ribosome-associated heat shock protein Hsp15
MKKVRIDKWLWSVRIFKTRTKATDACKSGRVKIDDKAVKASTLIVGGEILNLRKNSFDLVVKVVELLERRVSATLAEPCYENLTPEGELNKYKEWYVGKAAPERRERGTGRPTKRERRTIDDFKDNWMEDFDE